jgi:exosortase K
MKKNTPYYILTLVVFILLKIGYKSASNNTLGFLLKPTNKLVEIITNSRSTYSSINGFFYSDFNIVINKSCSGYNYWLILFIMGSFLGLYHAQNLLQKSIVIPISLLIGFVLTILVSTSRIYVSLLLKHQTDRISHLISEQSSHEIIGITINLTFLITTYLLIDRTLKNEKHTQS